MYINFLAEVPPVVVTQAAGEKGNDIVTIICSVVAATITVLGSLYISRKQQKTDNFSAFMKESSDFREEIRKELVRKESEYSDEIDKLHALLSEKQNLMVNLQKENENYVSRYKYLAEFMPQIVCTATAYGEIDYFNQRWDDYTGIDGEDAKGMKWASSVEGDSGKITNDWRIYIRRAVPFNMTVKLKNRESRYRLFLIRMVPRFDNAYHLVQWIGTFTDVEDVCAVCAQERKNETNNP